jgi:hypothetical protein
MLIAGAAVLVTSLWMHLKQVEALHQTLQPGVAGGIALVLLQLAFAPNAIVWSASYALGSGFSVGAGSVIAPAATQLGMVPGIPLLGALPAPGPGEPTQLCRVLCVVRFPASSPVRHGQLGRRGLRFARRRGVGRIGLGGRW